MTALAGDPAAAITAIANLTAPAKLETLKGERAANDRLHKIIAWLEEARRGGRCLSVGTHLPRQKLRFAAGGGHPGDSPEDPPRREA